MVVDTSRRNPHLHPQPPCDTYYTRVWATSHRDTFKIQEKVKVINSQINQTHLAELRVRQWQAARPVKWQRIEVSVGLASGRPAWTHGGSSLLSAARVSPHRLPPVTTAVCLSPPLSASYLVCSAAEMIPHPPPQTVELSIPASYITL